MTWRGDTVCIMGGVCVYHCIYNYYKQLIHLVLRMEICIKD